MMRPLPEIRGLRYPDEYVVRHFFKNRFDKRTGRVLELGCGSGNNLALYAAYGWAVTGVDIDEGELRNARWNLGDDAGLVQYDLQRGAPIFAGHFDVLLVPNVLCCVLKSPIWETLRNLRSSLTDNAHVYVRTRLMNDHRFGRGDFLGADSFRLTSDETGEKGRICTFYHMDDLTDRLRDTFGLTDIVKLYCRFDNMALGSTHVTNSDGIVWGRCG